MNVKINPYLIKIINKKGLNLKRSLRTLLCLYHGLEDPGAEEGLYESGIFTINNFGLFPEITFMYPLYVVEGIQSTKKEFDQFMVDWLKKWPTQSITGLQRSISGNTAVCKKRMTKFMNDFNTNLKDSIQGKADYKLICDTINKATDTYLNELQVSGYFYAKKNSKFIYDNDGSYLETYCRKVLKGEENMIASSDIMGRQA